MELRLEGITKKYKGIVALKNFTYSFTNGIYGILGPNGAGKSTLMNAITENINITEGTIYLNDTTNIEMGREYIRNIGYMPQQQNVYDNLSLNRFLFYMASLKGIKQKEAAEQIETLLDRVHLSAVRRKYMGQLSGGMKQRALIAQAVLGNPSIIILDEPTAGLDPKERISIRNLVSELATDKIVLISTHVVPDIEFIAKDVLIMNKGEIIRCGSVPELCSELDGMVYEIKCARNEITQLEMQNKVSGLASYGEEICARIITNTNPQDGVLCKPTLEELYLHLFE